MRNKYLYLILFQFANIYLYSQEISRIKIKKNTYTYFEAKIGLHSWYRLNKNPSTPFPIASFGLIFKNGKNEFSLSTEVDYSKFTNNKAEFSYCNFLANYGHSIFSKNKFQLSFHTGIVISKMIFGKYNEQLYDYNTQQLIVSTYKSNEGILDGLFAPRINLYANLNYKLTDKLTAKLQIGTILNTVKSCVPYYNPPIYPTNDCSFTGSNARFLVGISYLTSKNKPETRIVSKRIELWNFYTTLKIGLNVFQKRPTYSLGIRFQKNRHNLGINSYIEPVSTFTDRFGTKKYTYINLDTYYSFSIVRVKTFTTSLGIGVLNGKTTHATWTFPDGSQKNMSNQWRGFAFSSFIEFWFNINPKIALSNSYSFLSGYSDVFFSKGGSVEEPCFECNRESHSFRIYFSLYYRFFKQKVKTQPIKE